MRDLGYYLQQTVDWICYHKGTIEIHFETGESIHFLRDDGAASAIKGVAPTGGDKSEWSGCCC